MNGLAGTPLHDPNAEVRRSALNTLGKNPICRSIVEGLGGAIELESGAGGRNSRHSFFPCCRN